MSKVFRVPVLIATLVASLALCASANASIVTVGSPLTATFTKETFCSPLCINVNTTLPEPGAQVASPVNGTVTRWRVIDAVGGPYTLRVLQPDGSGNYTTVGTSAPETPVGLGVETFATSLAIKSGDLVGLQSATISAELGFAAPPGSIARVWFGTFPEGADTSTASSSDAFEQEVGFNADVESTPPPVRPPPSAQPELAPALGAQCIVPRLTGKKLKSAKKSLTKADCKLGNVTKLKGVTAKTGKVVKQSPKVGKVLPAGSKVSLRLG